MLCGSMTCACNRLDSPARNINGLRGALETALPRIAPCLRITETAPGYRLARSTGTNEPLARSSAICPAQMSSSKSAASISHGA